MRADGLYDFLETEFGKVLKREPRDAGRAYYWHVVKKGPGSTRLLRISETTAGDVAQIKLAQSSIAADRDVFLPLPASPEEVASQVRGELALLLRKE